MEQHFNSIFNKIPKTFLQIIATSMQFVENYGIITAMCIRSFGAPLAPIIGPLGALNHDFRKLGEHLSPNSLRGKHLLHAA
jgi:hypothetical protein